MEHDGGGQQGARASMSRTGTEVGGTIMEGRSARNRGGNVFVELQNRQWVPAEQWNWQLLHRYCEGRTIQRLRNHSSFQEVIRGKQSTMAIAFSHDGKFMASGHLTHEIIVCRTVTRMECFQTLTGHHRRTPWCLTFDPCRSHILYSGCLGGTVCKWDVQTGSCLNSWVSGIASPINSIVFLPSRPDHMLVALDHRLYLHCADNLTKVWETNTGFLSSKVRLVLHHPEDSLILTAISNPPREEIPFAHSLRTAYSHRTTYRLQVYQCGTTVIPNLEDTSHLLLSLSARVYGPHSCVLTLYTVICIAFSEGRSCIHIYSIVPKNFGHCLCTLPFDSMGQVVSLDLCGSHLLLGIVERKGAFHMSEARLSVSHLVSDPASMESVFVNPVVKIFHLVPGSAAQASADEEAVHLKPVCTLSSSPLAFLSPNTALWGPQRGCDGVCIGTQKGSVVYWGPGRASRRRLEEGLRVEWDSDEEANTSGGGRCA